MSLDEILDATPPGHLPVRGVDMETGHVSHNSVQVLDMLVPGPRNAVFAVSNAAAFGVASTDGPCATFELRELVAHVLRTGQTDLWGEALLSVDDAATSTSTSLRAVVSAVACKPLPALASPITFLPPKKRGRDWIVSASGNLSPSLGRQ